MFQATNVNINMLDELKGRKFSNSMTSGLRLMVRTYMVARSARFCRNKGLEKGWCLARESLKC